LGVVGKEVLVKVTTDGLEGEELDDGEMIEALAMMEVGCPGLKVMGETRGTWFSRLWESAKLELLENKPDPSKLV
jgi:hypothetical protein